MVQHPGHDQIEARNAALRIADEDIMILLDAEAWLDPDHVRRAVRNLASGSA